MSATVRRHRLRPGRAMPRLPRPGPRALGALLVVAAILVGAFFWVRQSSLVAVRRVTITGVSGPDVAQIRDALRGVALGMSTLDLDRRRLTAAVAPYRAVVRGLRLDADPPHGLHIAVSEEVPVAVIVAAGTRTLVDGGGVVLHGAHSTGPLPTITTSVVPGTTHVGGGVRSAVALLAAAPYALIARIASASDATAQGLTVTLRSGPTVVFGSVAQLGAKWHAAVDVLASASSAGASYIDVTVPDRPAAGTGGDVSTPAGAAPAATSTTARPTGTSGPD